MARLLLSCGTPHTQLTLLVVCTAAASQRDLGERKTRPERKREETKRPDSSAGKRAMENIPFKDLDVLATLGTGTFGRVRVCVSRRLDARLAHLPSVDVSCSCR